MTAETDIAALRQANAALRHERDAARARETALAEVLGVINRSPGDPEPVFEAILERAHKLCGANRGCLFLYDGTDIRAVATHGYADDVVAIMAQPHPAAENTAATTLLAGARYFQREDVRADTASSTGAVSAAVRLRSDVRTSLVIPLRKDGTVRGFLSANRTDVRPYIEAEITLLESFAAQAVIAMDNARLLGELHVRDEDNRRLIARQAASIEILRTISENPDDPQPVFETIAGHAAALCGGTSVNVAEYDGELIHIRALAGVDAASRERLLSSYPRPPEFHSFLGRVVLTGDVVHVRDMQTDLWGNEFNKRL